MLHILRPLGLPPPDRLDRLRSLVLGAEPELEMIVVSTECQWR